MKQYYKQRLLTVLMLVFTLGSMAQDIKVSGVVLDKEGTHEPLIQVTIIPTDRKTGERNMQRATATDLDGKFTVSIPANSNLVFTYIGYEQVVYKLGDKPVENLKIYMRETAKAIDEVVIAGKRIPKSQVTSAYTMIDPKDIADTPVSNIAELLQGRVAGMNIQMNNGTPGAEAQITLRGISDISLAQSGTGENVEDYTLLSATPLFVVDGIPQTDIGGEYDSSGLLSGATVSPLSMVPFEDIESIEILKDAAATSLYGSEGAYGVVLIQTKRGNSPKPRITYSGNFVVKTPPSLRDVLVGNAERQARLWQILQNDTSRYHGFNEIHNIPALSDSLNPYWNNNTDWQNVFYRTTYNQTHNVNFSGGHSAFNYKINGNYYTEKGIIESTKFDRYGITMNMGYRPENAKFSLMVKAGITFTDKSVGSGNAVSQTGVASGSNASSLLPPPSMYTMTNEALSVFSVDNQSNTTSYNTSAVLEYTLPYNIQWHGTFGYSYSTSTEDTFTPMALNTSDSQKQRAKMYSANGNSYNLYARTWLDKEFLVSVFRLGLTAGIEYSSKKKSSNSSTLVGLSSDYILGPVGASLRLSDGKASVSQSNNTFAVIFNPTFRLNTVGGDKYVLTPTLRPEMNSAYGTKLKWVVNPGLGFRWNFYQENFMKKLRESFLNMGAFRVSWGRTVKYKATRYNIYGQYDIDEKNTYNGNSFIPINFKNLPNVDLDPVTTTQWNAGLELNMLNNKVSAVIDAYYKQVDNQLSDVDLADHNSFSSIKSTDVSIVNYGLEWTIGVRPLPAKSPWDLNCMFSFAWNKDVIAKLPNEARQIINSKAMSVNRLGANALGMYLYVNKGVYATDADVPVDPATGKRLRVGGTETEQSYFKAGDPIWVDVNGDYVIDEKDKVIVGNSQPRMTGGVSINLRYKNFAIQTNASFVLRRDIINKALADRFVAYTDPLGAAKIDVLKKSAALTPIASYDFWTPEHVNATYPNPYDYIHAQTIKPFRLDQTLFMEDGSYFKLNTISVSYTFGAKMLNLLRVNSLVLRASMNNIFTFSGYSGINPESVNGLGYDTSGGYPNARSYTVGITLGL